MVDQIYEPYFEASINPAPEAGKIDILFAGESQTEPSHILGPQMLDYYLIHYALSGQGIFATRDQRYELQAGDSFFIFPNELVSYGSDPKQPWKYRWIAMKGTEVEDLLATAHITRERPVHREGRLRIGRYFRMIKQLIQSSDPRSQLKANAYVHLAVSEYMDNEPEESLRDRLRQPISVTQQQVEQAIRWFTLQYPQPISMETIASTLGYHRTHFSKIFKQYTGMSPMQYLTKVRMEKAELLLLKEPLTIQQVASSVGYTDALYFSKQFKKWFGVSPSEYRRRRQQT